MFQMRRLLPAEPEAFVQRYVIPANVSGKAADAAESDLPIKSPVIRSRSK